MKGSFFGFTICALALATSNHFSQRATAQGRKKSQDGKKPQCVLAMSPGRQWELSRSISASPNMLERSFRDNVVKGAPFSASTVWESVVPGGAQAAAPISGNIYRDSEGRTRLERITSLAGTQAERRTSIYISDAVGNLFYTLIPRSQIAIKSTRGASSRAAMITGRDEGSKQESLGKRIIEGVEAEGARTVRTIPAGTMDNNCPFDIVSERWYSPELQVVILAKWIDPLSDVETVYRLTNIDRREPDPLLFQVPPNYTIRERWSFRASGQDGREPQRRFW